MHILLVAATKLEIGPIIERLKPLKEDAEYTHMSYPNMTIEILITGVGIHPTTFALTKRLNNLKPRPDWIINAGIAGTFNDSLAIGDCVEVVEQSFGDWGVTDPQGFLSVFDLGFEDPNTTPFQQGRLINPNKIDDPRFFKATSVTSNISHGNIEAIKSITKQHQVDVESMEGAAIAYVCLQEKMPYLEIRTISNRVEIRNFKNWDIPLAKKNLCLRFFDLIEKLTTI